MDSDGVIVDEGWTPLDISTEEILTWYKNMVTSKSPYHSCVVSGCTHGDLLSLPLVSIMDIVMFDAQRQGRLSFYMVFEVQRAIKQDILQSTGQRW